MAKLTVNVVQIESVVDHPNADRLFFGNITKINTAPWVQQ